MKLLSKNWIWIIGFAIISAFSLSTYEAENKVLINETDALLYQLAAVNLVKYGEFPSIEVHEGIEQYKVYTNTEIGYANKVLYGLILNHPPANDFSKPPLYPLIISRIYSIFGVNPMFVFYFNLLLISFVVILQIKICYKLFGFKGLFIGVIVSVIFYSITILDAHKFYPHFIVQALITLLFLLFIDHKHSIGKNLFIGVLLGVLVLINGNTLFITFFYFSYLIFGFLKSRSINSSFLSMPVFLLMLVPWMIFANLKLQDTKEERVGFAEELWQDKEIETFKGEFIYDKNAPNKKDSIIITQCITSFYSKFNQDGFVLLSKQPFGDEILGAHNEFSGDGNFHPEWRFLEDSYYYKLRQEKDVIPKLASFYYDNPEFIIKNISGKFLGTINPLSFFYFLSGILFGLWGLSYVLKTKPLLIIGLLSFVAYLWLPLYYSIYIFLAGMLLGSIGIFKGSKKLLFLKITYFSLCNSIIITILFLGEPRYMQISDGILLVALVYLCMIALRRLYPSLQNYMLKLNGFFKEYLRPFRLREILLMSGYFIIAFFLSHSNLADLSNKSFFLYLGILLYISSVYMLNSYADYEIDQLNPRLHYLTKYSKNTYLILAMATLALALIIAFFIKLTLVLLFSFSFFLWVLYYVKPFRFKASAIAGTLIHFVAGISHFQIGYELGVPSCYLSIMISFFFATLLSLGHINHELIDQKADQEAGIINTATSYNKKTILTAFYILFTLSQIYLLLLYKWDFIRGIDCLAFFYAPILILIFIWDKGKKLSRPLFVQKLFRVLLFLSALILLLAKLSDYSGF